MRKLLNTLYVTTPKSYLSRDGQNLVVSVDKEERFRIPILNLEGVVTFGYLGASPGLMKLCVDNGVSLTFLSPAGRFIGRLQGQTKGNVFLRMEQYRIAAIPEESLHLARLIIAAKIQNQRNVLRRFIRDNGESGVIDAICKTLEYSKIRALQSKDLEKLRGMEGESATAYFSVFDSMILHQKKDFFFAGRNRRPPKDAVNALLSFAYTLMTNECAAALETVGLDPYVGFLHRLRPGRISLALDLVEEFRAYLCDRLVLSLINRRQISGCDFVIQGDDGVVLNENGRKTMITAWQSRKKEIIEHPYLHEKVEIGLLPYVQAMLLARYLRKDLDDYPIFISR
jgi:CRISPR-associated protein Cas1